MNGCVIEMENELTEAKKLQNEKVVFDIVNKMDILSDFLDYVSKDIVRNTRLYANLDWKGVVDNLQHVNDNLKNMRTALDITIKFIEKVKAESD